MKVNIRTMMNWGDRKMKTNRWITLLSVALLFALLMTSTSCAKKVSGEDLMKGILSQEVQVPEGYSEEDLQAALSFSLLLFQKSLEEKNIQELIAQALEQLSPRQREIFELSRNRGLSHKEIAEQLGLSVYTVQDHIKNALEKIRAYLIPFISACPILVSLIILKYVKP